MAAWNAWNESIDGNRFGSASIIASYHGNLDAQAVEPLDGLRRVLLERVGHSNDACGNRLLSALADGNEHSGLAVLLQSLCFAQQFVDRYPTFAHQLAVAEENRKAFGVRLDTVPRDSIKAVGGRD